LFALGALSGSRSMLTPALIATLRPGDVAAVADRLGLPLTTLGRASAALSFAEMLADKHPSIPARTTAIPLLGRIASGAAAGAVCANPGDRRRGACLGALGALTATFVLYQLRSAATRRWQLPNVSAGAIEDVVALAAGWAILRR
jgi:uncharacterized membrane protein